MRAARAESGERTFVQVCTSDEGDLRELSGRKKLRRKVRDDTIRAVDDRNEQERLWKRACGLLPCGEQGSGINALCAREGIALGDVGTGSNLRHEGVPYDLAPGCF